MWESIARVAGVLGVTAAASLSGVAQDSVQRDTRIVAVVAGRHILASDLQARIVDNRRQGIAENRLDAFGTKAASAALDSLVDVKLFAAAARAEGLLDRADVKHQIEMLVDDLLAQTFVVEHAARTPPSDDAIRRYYDANPREFEEPGRVHARHIVVSSEAEATTLLGRVRRSGDFEALARAHNIDSTRATGGDLGLVARGVMVEPFDRALFSLQIGEISPIIRTPQGFHIVKVERIEPGARKPLASVAGAIRQTLLQAEIRSWRAALAKTYTVSVNEQVLKSFR